MDNRAHTRGTDTHAFQLGAAPTHEEQLHFDPTAAAAAAAGGGGGGGVQAPGGGREGLAPRVMTFLSASSDDDACWIALETALATVERYFRMHPKFNLTPVRLLLQRHAAANMFRIPAHGVGLRKTGGMVSVCPGCLSGFVREREREREGESVCV